MGGWPMKPDEVANFMDLLRGYEASGELLPTNDVIGQALRIPRSGSTISNLFARLMDCQEIEIIKSGRGRIVRVVDPLASKPTPPVAPVAAKPEYSPAARVQCAPCGGYTTPTKARQCSRPTCGARRWVEGR